MASVTVTRDLLHEKDGCVLGDSGYTGAKSRPESQYTESASLIAKKRDKLKAIKNAQDRQQREHCECYKASIRAKMEQPSRVIKRESG